MSREISIAYEDKDVCCHFEDFQGFRFFHVEVKNFSRSKIAKWKEEFEKIKEKCLEDGYSSLYSYTRNKKFSKLLSKDFREIGVFMLDNKIFEVLRWELK